jgi:hypothetical protein
MIRDETVTPTLPNSNDVRIDSYRSIRYVVVVAVAEVLPPREKVEQNISPRAKMPDPRSSLPLGKEETG